MELTTCVVNPTETLNIVLPRYFERSAEQLSQYGLSSNKIVIVDHAPDFLTWIQDQADSSVGLVLLGSNETELLEAIRDVKTGRNKHKAMHPYGRIIGWSLHLEALANFQKAKADGFILKGRPLEQLTDQILTILDGRLEKSWVEIK